VSVQLSRLRLLLVHGRVELFSQLRDYFTAAKNQPVPQVAQQIVTRFVITGYRPPKVLSFKLEIVQDMMSIKPLGIVSSIGQRAVTAPSVIPQALDNPGSQRIAVNVSYQAIEICFFKY
jgi:hypothetical protein